MKPFQKPGRGIACLAMLIIIATLTVAGCTGSASGQQGLVTKANEKTKENPAKDIAVTTRTTNVQVQGTAMPVLAPVSSSGVITIDPIKDMHTGDTFTLTGTTILPEGTVLLWQVLPDTGILPTSLDGSSQMSVGGNNQVKKGNGTSNRISQAVSLGRLVPGKYVVIVGKMKDEPTTRVIWEINEDFGYTSFTIKEAGVNVP